jgi:hypothetical protein
MTGRLADLLRDRFVAKTNTDVQGVDNDKALRPHHHRDRPLERGPVLARGLVTSVVLEDPMSSCRRIQAERFPESTRGHTTGGSHRSIVTRRCQPEEDHSLD